mmetsp:Transcript_24717/g.54221  ORF Transcript_24717/g.54221 Transcript_24717/m.54221 type:complete len:212 (-) Transcript_24717:837-1472(-)
MTWIGYQTHVDVTAIGIGTVHARSQMVLDVARKPVVIVVSLVVSIHGVVGSGKFAKDQGHGLAHDVCEYVESTSVGHTQYERSSTEFASTIDSILQTRDDRLSTIQSESLGGVEFVGHEIFESVRKAQTLVNVCLFLLVVLIPVGIFHPLSDPIHLIGIPNVHVFDTQGSAVCFAQFLENFSQGYVRSLGQLLQIPELASARPTLENHFAL